MLTLKPASAIRKVIEDVTNFVAPLLSERSRCISGTNITIDGGYTAK